MCVKVATSCRHCGISCRVRRTVLDELGGRYYCSDCRTEAPQGHPQKTHSYPQCPECNEELKKKSHHLRCPHCNYEYNMMSSEVNYRNTNTKQ